MKKINVLSLLELLGEGQEKGKELSIAHLDSEVLHSTRARIFVQLIEMAYFYINNPKSSTAFHTLIFY